MYAVDDAFPGVFSYKIDEGNFILPQDNTSRKSVAVLGADIALELFPDGDAIGSYVRIFRQGVARSFKVVGVMKARTSTMRLDFDTSVYIPYETYMRRVQKADSVNDYFIGTKEGADVLAVADKVDEFFLSLTGNKESYRVMSPSTMAEMYTGISETLSLFLTGVAAISLIVGGIGIMNIMLVSVTERTKEIGIRKALGASPKTIRSQFLTEAAILTLSGGLVGMALGSGLSYFATRVLQWGFALQPAAFALALLFSSAIGIFFGLYPAVRAAKLQPVEALNFE